MKDIYDRISDLMHEKRIRIADLSRGTGINRGTLSAIFARRNNGFSHKMVGEIATYFGVTTDWLIFGKAENVNLATPIVSEMPESCGVCSYAETFTVEYICGSEQRVWLRCGVPGQRTGYYADNVVGCEFWAYRMDSCPLKLMKTGEKSAQI